mmetsp:Transcript_108923/g.172079  ORF Transcript_108923/g.172079 Transcript_108923/m.172079 type:complete len:187 (-) Transcript_108923:43-603(-)
MAQDWLKRESHGSAISACCPVRILSLDMGNVIGAMIGLPGSSSAILGYDQLCHSHRCRDNVVHEEAGDVKFVVDRHGTKWKCVSRRQLRDEPGDTWGCAELECRKPDWPWNLVDAFHYDADCIEPNIITTVDGEKIEDAPDTGDAYDPVEALGKPTPPACAMSPMILWGAPSSTSKKQKRSYRDFL